MILQVKDWKIPVFMVLPVRIELTTSPLPRGCSTTELRQRRAAEEIVWVRPRDAAMLAIRADMAQAQRTY
jgi:hypothetical protein